MTYRTFFVVYLFFYGLTSSVFAQKAQKKLNILPFPVVYYLPETRWAYGVAVTSTFRFKRDSTHARPSQLSFGAVRTQEKQTLLYLPFQLFYDNANYYANGEVGFFRYNFYYFGIGQQEVAQELYGVDFPRIKVNIFKKIAPKLYAGLRYQYEDYQITTTEPNGEFAAKRVPGTPRSRTSGVGLGLFYDSRDLIFFPSRGAIIDIAYFNNTPFWGGDVRFDRLSADASFYQKLTKNAVLATNLWASMAWGKVPFNMMAELGGPKKMRGYYQGRYRDLNVLLAQAEVRFDIFKRLGGVVFGSTGIMGNETRLLRTDDWKYSYGVGLRFTANRRDHLNIRVDYALGQNSRNFYLTIGEAF